MLDLQGNRMKYASVAIWDRFCNFKKKTVEMYIHLPVASTLIHNVTLFSTLDPYEINYVSNMLYQNQKSLKGETSQR